MIDRALVHSDAQRAVTRWAGAAPGQVNLTEAVDRALAVVDGAVAPHAGHARFCIVTKGAHLAGPTSLACVAARLLSFGVAIHSVRCLEGAGGQVARSLYPAAVRRFEHGPNAPELWQRLATRFDTEDFVRIFGRRYHRSLVTPGAAVLAENGLTGPELTRIWEAGRRPVDRPALVARYGRRAAEFVLAGGDSYPWFRAPLPIGISRVASGLTAFAMRDERINQGAPVIVVNGHVPGLSAIFEPNTWVFDLGITDTAPQIRAVRQLLAGDDSRPQRCRPGSIRRDAVEGLLPLSDDSPVTVRRNLLHCSDGLVAGLAETRALMPDPADADDLLTTRLLRAGLTAPEIDRIVLRDPRVRHGTVDGHLTDVTSGLDLDACLAETVGAVPPVFGPANGYADGVPFETVERALTMAMAGPSPSDAAVPGADDLPRSASAEPGDDDLAAGREAIAAGQVGALVPAGGTGGRFGGYAVPESDAARQKSLLPVFRLLGRRLSSLDIRLANVRHWNDGDAARVPLGIMGSSTNESALRRWRSALEPPYRTQVELFVQHGLYRVDLDRLAGVGQRWIDVILRDSAGRPSLKPSGAVGLVTAFILSGLLDRWQRRGIAYVASANGDDVGYRIDPAVIGYLAHNPQVDCVFVGVPWGFTTKVRRAGAVLAARGDESGWSMDETGAPLPEPLAPSEREYDTGHALCLRPGPDGMCLAVVEARRPTGTLFNTNQLYLRLSAIRRLVDATAASDPVEAARRMTARLRIAFEDKTVLVDGVEMHARQIHQPLHVIHPWLTRCDLVAGTRRVGGGRGTYAPLKRPIDATFGQLILEQLWRAGDDLLLPSR